MKGTVFDIMLVGVMIVVIMITVLIGHTILDEFSTQLSANNNETMNATYFETGKSALGTFNIGIVMVFVMGIIASLLLAVYMDAHPAFVIISIIGIVIIITLVMPIMTNLYGAISGESTFATSAESFTIAKLVIDSLPLWVAIGGGLVVVALYVKRGDREGV